MRKRALSLLLCTVFLLSVCKQPLLPAFADEQILPETSPGSAVLQPLKAMAETSSQNKTEAPMTTTVPTDPAVPETTAAPATEPTGFTEADFKNAIAYIEKCRDNKELSYAAFAIGNRGGELFHWCLDGTTDETLFDMASVTKIIATTTLFMIAQKEGLVHWNDPLSKYFPDAPADKANIPLWRFMSHSSGIRSYKVYNYEKDPSKAYEEILSHSLGYATGTGVTYSCLNMILIGRVLEIVYDKPLDVLFTEKVAEPLNLANTGYKLFETDAKIAVHQSNRNRVNDGQAHFLGDVVGNAGIFSNIVDMSKYAVELANGFPSLEIPQEMFVESIQNHTAGGSSNRAIGWALLGDSAPGCLLPNGSYGHTGWTGQSIFVDPQTGLWVVFLTNSQYHGASSDGKSSLRGGLYDALADDLGC